MKESYADIQGLLKKNMLGRSPAVHKCWPESCGNAVFAARRLYEILLLSCEWDSRVRDRHYHIKQWSLQGEKILDWKNVAHQVLVDKTKIYLPPLQHKLGLIKISVISMKKEGEVFDSLGQTFPRNSETKIKEGIFVSPQVKQLCQDPDF